MSRAALLDPITGEVEDYVSGPIRPSEEVEREIALRKTRKLIDQAGRVPGLVGTTTTNRYLSYPAAAAGISRASSGSTAWSFSAYTEVVPVNTITSTFYIAALVFHPPAATATATTNEYVIEIATGATSSEVTILQLPYTVRNVTAAGYIPPGYIELPEPKQVAANTRLSVRFAYSVATTSVTITGIKIMYQMA